jgi:CRISPR-associated protein Csy3
MKKTILTTIYISFQKNKKVKTMSNEKFELPSVLSYSRSIQASSGYFYAEGLNGELTPISIIEENLRASFSDFGSGSKRSDTQLSDGNIHRIESAYLPQDSDTLVVKFNFKVVSNFLKPSNTNEENPALVLEEFSDIYMKAGGTKYLANKYIKALISGDFLWRNKTVADSIQITINVKEQAFVFNVPSVVNDVYYNKHETKINELSSIFEKCLTDESFFALFEVETKCFLGKGQEVFPSQEFVDKDKSKADRILSSVNNNGVNQATFHKDKLSNAIRKIDTWYPESNGRALAIEPYGLDQSYSVARRTPKNKKDFYSLIQENLFKYIEDLKNIKDGSEIESDVHFIVACLIRGGVYSGKSKKK